MWCSEGQTPYFNYVLLKQPGHNQSLTFVIVNNQAYQSVGLKRTADAQGFMSSIDTCLPFGGTSLPFKSMTDLFFTRTKRLKQVSLLRQQRDDTRVIGVPRHLQRRFSATVFQVSHRAVLQQQPHG